VAKVEIRFDTERPMDSEIWIDGEKVKAAYNVRLDLDVNYVNFAVLKYMTDENGHLITDEHGAKSEMIQYRFG